MALCIVDGLPPGLVRCTLQWVERELKKRGLYQAKLKPHVILVTLKYFNTTVPDKYYYGVMMSVPVSPGMRVCLIRINPKYLKNQSELIHRLVHEATHAYGLPEAYARDMQEHAKEVMKHGYGQFSSCCHSTRDCHRSASSHHEVHELKYSSRASEH